MTDRGVTLVELLIAVALSLAVLAAGVVLVDDTEALSQVLPEATDMQQRARASTDALWRDVGAAGAGLDGGPSAGPLIGYFAPILPRRLGVSSADPTRTARADVVTLISVPKTASESSLAVALSSGATTLAVVQASNCAPARPVCGLAAGARAVVFDRAGGFDLFAVIGPAGQVAPLSTTPTASYAAGLPVAEADVRVYYFDAINQQLRLYDAYQTDTPVLDNVVSFSVEYFGDPAVPIAPKPAPGVANCLFDALGNPTLSALAATPGASLVPLPLALFQDGPWCGAGGTEFDADLLRIRRVRLTVRFQAALAGLRGTGPDFLLPGTSRSFRRQLPDLILSFDVAPRNLRSGT